MYIRRRYDMGLLLRRGAPIAVAAVVLVLTASIASADGPGWKTVATDFEGPLFSLNVGKDDHLLTADGVGPKIVDPDDGDVSLIASLPNVSDVIQTGRREYLALTGEGEPGDDSQASLYRIKNGNVTRLASVLEAELAADPDGSGNVPEEDSISNPFDLAKLMKNKTVIADAGGNTIWVADRHGNLDWVATLPYQDIETQPVKDAAGCPTPPPGLEFLCGLPPVFTIDPVSTTVDIGPDGYIYAGELAGFPGPVGVSRVWRIDPDARHVQCGTDDDDCTLVNTGPLTSIIDIKFKGKTAYVVELDEAGWFLSESGLGQGGTVNACRQSKGGNGGNDDHDDFNGGNHDDDDDNGGAVTWSCEVVATGLPFPTAVAIEDDDVYVTLLVDPETFAFEVARLTNGDDEGNDDDDDEDDDD
jgi:hypothetical protein